MLLALTLSLQVANEVKPCNSSSYLPNAPPATYRHLSSPFWCCTLSTLFLWTAAFLTQKVQLDDATVKFEIWDTAGQERYRSLAPMYYRGAAAAIVVYDVTNKARLLELNRSTHNQWEQNRSTDC